MSLCPEAAQRAAMTDAEFWAHVFRSPELDPYDDPPDAPALRTTPCPECGEAGACAWDAKGRPLIHATDHED